MGLDDVWAQQNGRTGELLLIDRTRTENRVLSTFGHDDLLPMMVAAFTRVLDPS